MAWASQQPAWAIGFLDEVWWSRLAQPSLHAWTADKPLRLIQNAPDRIDAEDDRKGLNRTRTKQVEARPGALEGDLEEELERRDGDRRGGAGAAALFVEGEKELAQLLLGNQVW